ncbi:ADAMTS3 [Acanthosepion pharaonis]|uniref:ADAMTS3 n=1 Tax=Acanthosepion pharaonis TaxID=158019 RepID=A0A812BYS2_ACAPH|nr:ADAMTS3 [Sepia pharaonis]
MVPFSFILLLIQVGSILVSSLTAKDQIDTLAGSNCSIKRREFVIPYVTDIRGRPITYKLPNKGDDEEHKVFLNGVRMQAYPDLPNQFNVAIRWRLKVLNLLLHKTELTNSNSFIEWTENNVTGIRQYISEENCYYQGFIAGMDSSFVAISACNGLTGLIRTDTEDLFIRPINHHLPLDQNGQSHFIYYCKNSKLNENITDTPGKSKSGNKIFKGAERLKKKKVHKEQMLYRTRRDIPSKYFLEVLLVTDNTIINFHGKDNVQQYLLAMINIMNAVYQHPSLGIKIEVVLKRVVILDERDSRDIIDESNAQTTLDRFCLWSNNFYAKNKEKESNYDISIFLTRRNIGPAGYAPVTGMCRPHRSCSINRDDGLTSGFIVAHEAAHVFGLQHDGQGNHCYGSKYQGSIMAPMVESTFDRYYWSDCSAARMRHYVYHLTCLRNNPKRRVWPVLPTPVGVNWDLDGQCRQEFGEGFRVCGAFREQDPCSRLWCSHRDNIHMCRTKNGPPLSGTKCGFGQWCLDGACQYKSNLIPIDGSWGSWGSWGSCSVTCNMGARFRQRKCNNPSPAFGGTDCEGKHEEFKICKNMPCINDPDMRAEQCANFDGYVIGHKRHTWKPIQFDNGTNPCKLTCISKETSDILKTEADVKDGTLCTYENRINICVRGICQELGCDGVLGSKITQDKCGTCGGDDTNCKIINGTFYDSKESDLNKYRNILVLPKGARHIYIKNESPSEQKFLALKDEKYGIFLLNGKGLQEDSQKFVAKGTRFHYVKRSTSETLETVGPLNAFLVVMLYTNDHNNESKISYYYTSVKSDYTFERNNYKWQFDKWSDCSVTCGSGKQSTTYNCVDIKTNEILDKTFCLHLDEPRIDTVNCKREQCLVTRWKVDGWSTCSSKCGYDGEEVPIIYCVSDSRGKKEEVLSDAYCDMLLRPNSTRPCNRQPCAGEWSVEDWSQCSVSCGEGIQVRTVTCVKPSGSSTDFKCKKRRPLSTQKCTKDTCEAKVAECTKDNTPFCKYGSSARTCSYSGYRSLCCKSCQSFSNKSDK